MRRAGLPALAAALSAALPGSSSAQPRPAPVLEVPADSSSKPPPLDGATHDYAYGYEAPAAGEATVPPERRWLGRAFVHRLAAADPSVPRPVLVFLHGINAELIKYRWMGGGHEGDVRRIVADLIEAGKIPPIVVAAPSAVIPAATVVARTSWPAFDLDTFLDVTARRLHGITTIDRARVLVAAHSGGGCNASGGIATALRAAPPLHAALVIDTCMDVDLAAPIAHAPPTTHVVVSWQLLSWSKRPIRDFRRVFEREAALHAPVPGVLRELEQLRPTAPMPHDAMVPLVLRRWLPPLLSADAAPSLPCVSP